MHCPDDCRSMTSRGPHALPFPSGEAPFPWPLRWGRWTKLGLAREEMLRPHELRASVKPEGVLTSLVETQEDLQSASSAHVHQPLAVIRTADYRGNEIIVRTSYEIEVEVEVDVALVVGDDGHVQSADSPPRISPPRSTSRARPPTCSARKNSSGAGTPSTATASTTTATTLRVRGRRRDTGVRREIMSDPRRGRPSSAVSWR